MDTLRKRRLLKLLHRTQGIFDAIGLLCLTGYLALSLPSEVLNSQPATGGDMGSHFWPLWSLVHHGIPNGTLRVWSPGNLGGEPLLVHYFPFPFLFMSFLSLFLPLGTAFNVGTLIPSLTFPVCIYVCLKGIRIRFPGPLMGSAFGLLFLFNETYSMAGGNLLSTLAGQFAHGYALNFLLIGLGAFGWEIRRKKTPILSSLCFAGVFLSHGYIFIGLPFILLSLVLFLNISTFRVRIRTGIFSLTLAGLLSFWFLLPMFSNAPWTTAFSVQWSFEDSLKEAASQMFIPPLGLLVGSLVCFGIFRKRRKDVRFLKKQLLFWLVPIGVYAVVYVFARPLGVVNVRALPQIYLFFLLLTACLASFTLNHVAGRAATWLVTLPLLLLSIFWADSRSTKFATWARWNYSGWESKRLYPDLEKLASRVHGNFSMPRIIYEHDVRNNAAGTVRVFEMLPYFARRATLESVYLQATILAPMAFYLQAEVSKTPSCPFWDLDCPGFDIASAIPRLRLMGVGDLILTTDETIQQAEKTPELEKRETIGPWALFQMRQPIHLAGTFDQVPEFLNTGPAFSEATLAPKFPSFKNRFYEWFKKYDGSQRLVVVGVDKKLADEKEIWSAGTRCQPEVEVDFNQMVLETPCPGTAHFLKFAYHPTWETDTGDPLFLVSPGFIGVVPSRSTIHLRFGQSRLWQFASVVSILTLLLVPGSPFVFRRIL